MTSRQIVAVAALIAAVVGVGVIVWAGYVFGPWEALGATLGVVAVLLMVADQAREM